MLRRPHAHVDYVTDPEASPDPIGFLLDALGAAGIARCCSAPACWSSSRPLLAWARWRPMEEARLRFIERARGYTEYLPWIVRLSVGLVLIGAGLSRVRFMPTIDSGDLFGLLLTGTGFLLLLGLAVRPAALVALGAYLVTLVGPSGAGDDARRRRRPGRGRRSSARAARASTICCAPPSRAARAREPRRRTSRAAATTT